MTTSELKEYIFKENKIEIILEQLGCHNIKYHDKQEYYSACQPDGDNPQGVNVRNNQYLNYRSFSRGIDYEDGKDIINLVEKVRNCSFVDAVKYIHKILGLKFKFEKKSTQIKKVEDPAWTLAKHSEKYKVDVSEIQSIKETVLDDYIPLPYIGWVREGVMPWTVKKFGLAYSYRRKRVIIPMRHWKTGELLGINSRTTVENWEEFGIKKFYITPSYQKNKNLFGLYENYQSINNAGYVVIVEAEKSVLKRDSLNDDTLIALSGHSISNDQVSIIHRIENLREVIIALDKDVPIEEVRHMCEKFYNSRKVSYIYDKWGLLKEKDSPADAPNKIYNFLMKYRISYGLSEHKQYLKDLANKK